MEEKVVLYSCLYKYLDEYLNKIKNETCFIFSKIKPLLMLRAVLKLQEWNNKRCTTVSQTSI